jgi:hypothetical protein
MTTVNRLRAWLAKPRSEVSYVALQHDRVGQPMQFCIWRATEVGANLEDCAQRILQECDDYAGQCNESVRVLIQLLDNGKEVIVQLPHTATPDEPMTTDEANAAQTSSERVIAMFMRHVENLQRTLTGSQSSIYTAFERTLEQNQRIIERQGLQIQNLMTQLEAARAQNADDDEETEEQRTEALARARAWDKAGELIPAVAEAVIAHASSRVNGSGGAQ